MISLDKKYIKLSWPKAKEIVMAMGFYSKMSDPIGQLDWSLIGLKYAPEIQTYNTYNSTYGWRFEIINKKKLSFMMLKYGFSV